jgi:hypothetical protein
MNNSIFLAVTLCGSCKNRRFGEFITSIIKVTRIGQVLIMLAVNSIPALVVSSDLARTTRCHISEDSILHGKMSFEKYTG